MSTGTAGSGPLADTATAGTSAQAAKRERYIERQLRRTRRQVRSVELASRLMLLATAAVAFFLIAAVVDHWLVPGGLSIYGRLAFLAALLLGGGWFVAREIAPLFVYRINPLFAAHTIERAKPTLKNSLLNFLLLRSNHAGVPEVVLTAVEEQAATNLERTSIEHVVDRTRVVQLGYLLLAMVAAFCTYFLLSPKSPLQTVGRVVLPWSDLQPPSRVQISDIQPGTATVFRGERATLSAEIHGLKDGEAATLFFSTADRQSVDQPVRMYVTKDSYGRHTVTLPPAADTAANELASAGLQQDIEYRIEAGDAVSRTYRLSVVQAPNIVVEKLDYVYPEYTRIDRQTVQKSGDIRAVEGTQVTIHALANQPIGSAYLDLGGDGRHKQPMQVTSGRDGGQRATAIMTLALNEERTAAAFSHYFVRFVTDGGHENREPIRYRIEVTPDPAPEVQFLRPEKVEMAVPLNALVTFELEASDELYGLADLRIVANIGGEPAFRRNRSVSRDDPSAARLVHKQVERLDRITLAGGAKLKSGDVIEYWAEAADHKTPKPNVTRSEVRKLVIVEPRQDQNRGQQQDEKQGENQGEDQPNDNPQDRNNQPPNDRDRKGEQKSNEQKSNDRQNKNEQGGSDDAKNNEQKTGGSEKGGSEKGGSEKGGSEKGGSEKGGSEKGGSEKGGSEKGGSEKGGSEKDKNQSKDGQRQPNDRNRQGEKDNGAERSQDPGGENNSADRDENNTQKSDDNAGAKGRGSRQPNTSQDKQDRGASSDTERSQQRSADSAGSQENQDANANRQDDPQNQEQKSVDKSDEGGAFQRILDHAKQKEGKTPEQPGDANDAKDDERAAAGERASKQNQADKTNAKGTPEKEQDRGPDGDRGKEQKQADDQPGAGGEQRGETDNAQKVPSRDKNGKQGNAEKSGTDASQEEAATTQQSPAKDDSHKAAASGAADEKQRKNEERDADKGASGQPSPQQKTQPATDNPRNDNPTAAQNGAKNEKQQEQPPKGAASNTRPDASKRPKDDQSGTGNADQKTSDDPSEKSSGAGDKSEKESAQKKNGRQPGANRGGQKDDKSQSGVENKSPDRDAKSNAAKGQDGQPQNEKGSEAQSEKGGQPEGASPETSNDQNRDNSDSDTPNSKGAATNGGGGRRDRSAATPPAQPPAPPQDDKANQEYARRATDLALDHLRNQLKDDRPDEELLDSLGWSKEDLRKLLARWERLEREAKQPGPTGVKAKQELQERINSLGIRPSKTARKASTTAGDAARHLRDSARSAPPPEYKEAYDAFKRRTSQGAK